jgi:membrane associated rhomboid family serine protease
MAPRTTSGTSPISIPPFTGATRNLLVWNILVFFVMAVCNFALPAVSAFVFLHFDLWPVLVVHGQVWQLVTYSFLTGGFANFILAMMSLWWSGNFLESIFGARWMYQLYFGSTIGAALITIPLTHVHLFGLYEGLPGGGCWAPLFALLVAIAYFYPDMEINLLVLRMKAKVMVALYILLFTAEVLTFGNRTDAVLQLAGGLAGYLFCKFVPKRGYAIGFSLSERYYAMRNEFYRAKRRKAAKQFEVYMRKQDRDVHFDSNGKYVEPDEKNPNDKRWMN